MAHRWHIRSARGLLVSTMLTGALGLCAAPAAALSLNPLDYYSYDYYIALSHSEVEPGETFTVTVGADVRCTKDLPIGVNEAAAEFSVHARHTTSGEELTLLENYGLTVTNVPDWAGDEYSTTESVDLLFPSGATLGAYSLVAELEHLSLDGWNVTSMVPSSSRAIGIGSIVCDVPDTEPTPPPPTELGVLIASIMGHEFRSTLDDDGYLLEPMEATLIEGLLTIEATEGTRCVDESGSALSYLSASQILSPEAYEGGVVLSAFSLRPDGAAFSPSLLLGICYSVDELPPGCDEDELRIARYDPSDGAWHELPSVVDADASIVLADVVHFSVYGLLAPAAAASPAQFSIRDLTVSPVEVAPFQRVDVAVTIANTGGSASQYPLVVSIDGSAEHSETVLLEPRQSRIVRLTVIRSVPGTYQVNVEHLTRSFVVAAPGDSSPSGMTPAGEPLAPSENPATDAGDSEPGMHPVYVALLVIAGIAFITLVVLVLAGAL